MEKNCCSAHGRNSSWRDTHQQLMSSSPICGTVWISEVQHKIDPGPTAYLCMPGRHLCLDVHPPPEAEPEKSSRMIDASITVEGSIVSPYLSAGAFDDQLCFLGHIAAITWTC
ncbi:hypothetical protein AAFF_G00103310 [Aldrovandia affinis]|uniref:Uncharacterized protein n=1 Tax=Aldrovandia affinis TaxID=143900 RepID=A0AAD7RUD0_9TELE|nr:hypothetical protein AAFF_G00103310 [Aldrovandia affinis]